MKKKMKNQKQDVWTDLVILNVREKIFPKKNLE